MNNLESLAKTRFEQYSKSETGKVLNWYHLPQERKVAWMQEVLDGFEFIIKNLKDRLKLDPVPGRMNTTYALGRAEGINSEKMRYIQELTLLAEDLHNELDYFEECYAKQQQFKLRE